MAFDCAWSRVRADHQGGGPGLAGTAAGLVLGLLQAWLASVEPHCLG